MKIAEKLITLHKTIRKSIQRAWAFLQLIECCQYWGRLIERHSLNVKTVARCTQNAIESD